MNLSLFRGLGPRRRISLWRALGPGAWFSIALWSAVVLVVLGASRNPDFITRLTSASGLGEAAGLLLGVVSPVLLPLVVAGVALVVVPLRLLREVRRALGGRRRGGSQAYRDGGIDNLAGASVLGGGLLGGLVNAFDGDDGEEGGDGDE